VALAAGVVTGTGARRETTAPRRADGKAYPILDETRRLPRIGTGQAERTLATPPPPFRPRRTDDPVLAESSGRRRLIDATCDADLVAIGRVEAPRPFLHPNGRWILTAYDLSVTQVLRMKGVKGRAAERIAYVHPSGTLTTRMRTDTTVVDRFATPAGDEDYVFFLVRIGKSERYRSSLDAPVLTLRGGSLYALALPAAWQDREAIDGMSAREALRAVDGAICRPERPAPADITPGAGEEFIRTPPD
jgi:hypothetical protein